MGKGSGLGGGAAHVGTPFDGLEQEEFIVIKSAGLSDKHRHFVHAWMRHRSTKRAAIEAGYSPDSAQQIGQKLINKPDIRELINALLDARMRRIQATPKVIEEELAKVAFASVGRFIVVQPDGTAYLDFAKADDADLAGLTSFRCEIMHKPGDSRDDPKQVMKMEVKLGDKLGALTALARIRKMIGGDEGADALVDIAAAIREGRKRAGMKD